jgi:predicted DCC family thiol-disulfide oxidoreductase YuxK
MICAGIRMSVSELDNAVCDFGELGGRLLVVFDGYCGFCNWFVRWLLKRDRLDRLRFVASDSPKVAELLAQHGIAATEGGFAPNTIVVVRDPRGSKEQIFVSSEAVIALLCVLPRPWPAAGIVLAWTPRPVRDLGYRLIARWRYRIWGRLQSCPLPAPEERKRFV